jgi:hypothetical protein
MSGSKFKKSIGDFMLEELGSDSIEKYWSSINYELGLDPFKIGSGSHHTIWIRCQCVSYHEDYPIAANNFKAGKRCSYCRRTKIHPYDSFAMWGIHTYGQSFLDDYWDYEKNNTLNIDPWNIAINYSKKVWIKCQIKEYHDSYLTIANNFTSKNVRCPQCKGYNIHPLDSLGSKFPDSLLLWSDKNDQSPFDYASRTEQEVYWMCENEIHEDYCRRIDNSVLRNFRCPECHGKFKHTQEQFETIIKELVGNEYVAIGEYINIQSNVLFIHNIPECGYEFPMRPGNFIYGNQRCPACSESKGEKRIRDWLINRNINYEPQMKYDNLLGVGGNKLSYDFNLPNQNILIEYQGEQHDHYVEYFHKSIEDFNKQLEHDNRKRQYAIENEIKLLEIWYWDYDNIEMILEKELI